MVTLLLSRGSGRAEGIPEPGLVFYGNVTDAAQVKYTSGTLSWSLAPTSGGDALLAVTELQAGDPTGYSYCLILPCETLLSGMVASTNTLRLTTPPTAYESLARHSERGKSDVQLQRFADHYAHGRRSGPAWNVSTLPRLARATSMPSGRSSTSTFRTRTARPIQTTTEQTTKRSFSRAQIQPMPVRA